MIRKVLLCALGTMLLASACTDDGRKEPALPPESQDGAADGEDEPAPADGEGDAPDEPLDPLRTPEMLLAERRAAMAFSSQSAEEREQTARKVQTVLDELYVNRAHKLETYGAEADVSAALQALVAGAAAMTNAAFQTELHRIVTSQRDNTLTYVFARPMACFFSRLPVQFRDLTERSTGQKVVAVTSLEARWLEGDARNIQIGDVLLGYGADSLDEALAQLGAEARGASPASVRAFGISMLGFRPHFVTRLPERDEVTLRLQRADGSEYTATVPWVSRLEFLCLDPTRPHGEPERLRAGGLRDATDTLGGEPIEHPDASMFDARTLDTEQGRFGWITLHSLTSVLDVDAALFNLGGVLGQLEDTEALLIDVRGNAGGETELAEAASKFFVPGPITSGGTRFRNTPLNERLVRAMLPGTVYESVLDAAILAGADMTEVAPLLNLDFVNQTFAQAYTKPVLVLTDAFCMGACEIFVAALQDNAAATLIGLDESTGGNVAVGLSTPFVADLLGTDLPFDGSGPIILFGHRQYVRGSGLLVEDVGVTPERKVALYLDEQRAGVDLEAVLRKRLLGELANLAGK